MAGGQRRSDEHADDAQHHHVYGGQRRSDRRRFRYLQCHLDRGAGEAARHRDPQIDGLSGPRHPADFPDPRFAARVRGQRLGAAVWRRADAGADADPVEISRWQRSGAVADGLELAAIRNRCGLRRGCGSLRGPVAGSEGGRRPARRHLARRAMTEAVIEAEGLTRRLAGEVTVTLVEDATLMVHQGEFVAITGASGSGKSSLLYLLGLLDRPTSGRIWLRGDETSTLEEDMLAGLRLAEVGFVYTIKHRTGNGPW